MRFSNYFLIFIPAGLVFLWYLFSPSSNSDNVTKTKFREIKVFVNSAYYYPTSKSLGDNAVAFVMSMNLEKNPDPIFENQDPEAINPDDLVIMASNGTSNVTLNTKILRISPWWSCQLSITFATVQLIPNVKSISMVSHDGSTEIPFKIPSSVKRDVVVCTSPLFVNEQWQNFLFAVHIYRKYGAFVNVYVISAVREYFQLIQEYEKQDYLTIQPWVSVKFPGVSPFLVNSQAQVEFRNQAAAQSDCLLKYKETAQFITFLDLDDVIIPKLAPTFLEEFQMIYSKFNSSLAYITYAKKNHKVVTVRDGSKFSMAGMMGTLELMPKNETGKIVIMPKNLNYTWIHRPPSIPEGKFTYDPVQENSLTHLKTIHWTDKDLKVNMTTSESIMTSEDIADIDDDFQRMARIPNVARLLARLPKRHLFSDMVVRCFTEKFYAWSEAWLQMGDLRCAGPHQCVFKQHSRIRCTHVVAKYSEMTSLTPFTYYFATEPGFSDDVGCFPH